MELSPREIMVAAAMVLAAVNGIIWLMESN